MIRLRVRFPMEKKICNEELLSSVGPRTTPKHQRSVIRLGYVCPDGSLATVLISKLRLRDNHNHLLPHLSNPWLPTLIELRPSVSSQTPEPRVPYLHSVSGIQNQPFLPKRNERISSIDLPAQLLHERFLRLPHRSHA